MFSLRNNANKSQIIPITPSYLEHLGVVASCPRCRAVQVHVRCNLTITRSRHFMTTELIPKALPVLSTDPVLRKSAVDREIRFSTEQYGCRQRNDFVK